MILKLEQAFRVSGDRKLLFLCSSIATLAHSPKNPQILRYEKMVQMNLISFLKN